MRIHQTLRISSKKINSTIHVSIPAINTSNVADALMFLNSGLCGKQKALMVYANTLRRFSTTQSSSLAQSNNDLDSEWFYHSLNAPIFASGMSHPVCVASKTKRNSTRGYIKSRRRSKSVWWRKEPWWSPISHRRTCQTSSASCFRIPVWRTRTCYILSASSNDSGKIYKLFRFRLICVYIY